MTHLCLFLSQLLVLTRNTNCKECQGSYGGQIWPRWKTNACQPQCLQGTRRLGSLLLTKSCICKEAELSKTTLTLRDTKALSGQTSALGKELMAFMLNF